MRGVLLISAGNLAKRVLLGAAVVLSAAVGAAQNPVGALTVHGKAVITAQGVSFTLHNEGYAYISGDGVSTAQGARAVLLTADGLKVVFTESSLGAVTRVNGVYGIDVRQGRLVVDADAGVAFELFNNGVAMASNHASMTEGGFVIAAEPKADDAQSYTPAALTQKQIDSLKASKIFLDVELECLIEKMKNIPQEVLKTMTREELAELIDCKKRAGVIVSNGKIALLVAILAAGTAIVADDSGSDS